MFVFLEGFPYSFKPSLEVKSKLGRGSCVYARIKDKENLKTVRRFEFLEQVLISYQVNVLFNIKMVAGGRGVCQGYVASQ